MTRVYIIRHAEADGNIYRRIHGQYDGWITENGYAQLEKLAERMKTEKIDAVYSSDLFRAVKTAEALTAGRDILITEKPALREINLGVWEDKTWGEVALHEPEMLNNFNNKPWLWSVAEAETPQSVMDRMYAAFLDIVRENEGKTVAICSHGMAIRFLICRILCKHLREIEAVGHSDNTGISLVELENGTARVVYMNDNSHLGDLSTLARQKWWRKKGDTADGNTWFAPVDFKSQTDILRHSLDGQSGFLLHLGEGDLITELMHRAQRDKRSVVFAYVGNVPIGAVALDIENSRDSEAGRLDFLFLDQEYKKSGYGIQLIGYAVSIYRLMDKKFVEIEVHCGNTEAIAFFSRHAFQKVSQRERDSGEIWRMRKIIDYYRN